MSEGPQPDVTELLRRWKGGDSASGDVLLPLVEDELRRIARGRLASMRRQLRPDRLGGSLETAGLVNEAYLRLVGERKGWENRAHFFAIAATQMRRICIDYARRVHAEKRGGGTEHRPFDEATAVAPDAPVEVIDLLALNRALEDLEALDARQARIVELKYFVGLGEREIGEVLGISEATVRRGWTSARAWLYQALSGRPG